ncbi:MAG: hypothetical protein KIT84_44080 [Labilithrix sp.]|nr:hypothetical protein [Labilithrix sp.]MCW5818058.1 hypothetical protein [Labilithrix sp.]
MNTSGGPGDKPRDIGLKAIHDARIERGASKAGRVSGMTWLFGIGTVLVVVIGAWIYRDRSLDAMKEELFSKQRAATTTVGAEWYPLRERLEKLTIEAAAPEYKGDHVDPAAAKWNLTDVPGLYLRMRTADAKDAESLRKKAKDSARDSFVGCFLRENNPSMAAAAKGEDAGTGWNDQPWNLRLAYQTTRILSEEWTTEAKNAEDEIHFRVFMQQYEKAIAEEIPHAIDIVKRAQFFLLVLDEDVDEAMQFAPDSGYRAGQISEEGLQQVVHPSRVHLIDLRTKDGDPTLLRVRRSADADFHFVSGAMPNNAYTLSALKRQVMNCNLAEQVKTALNPTKTADAALDAGAAPDAK